MILQVTKPGRTLSEIAMEIFDISNEKHRFIASLSRQSTLSFMRGSVSLTKSIILFSDFVV